MISVIIPVYNRPEMLLQAVKSVLGQSYPELELIVVDDGSETDLSNIKKLVEDAGHSWLRQERSGVAAARNRGLEQARYDWLALLDSDDYWHRDKLSRQMEFHKEHPEFLLSQCEERWHRDGVRVNKKKYHAMAQGDAFEDSLERCCISASSIMLHRSVIEDVGIFCGDMVVCEDYDLWIRVTSKYEIGLLSDELVFKFGGHEDQLSKSQPAMDRFRLYALLRLLSEQHLSNAQRALALAAAAKKAEILALGAEKRAPLKARFYRNTVSALENDKHLKPYINTIRMDIYPLLPKQRELPLSALA